MSTTVGKLSVELGISDDQLRAGLAAAMVQAQQAGQKISQSMNQAGQASGGNKGISGFALSISRIADDAQYGFRGIINNMEQLGTSAAQTFGMSTANAMAFGGAMTLLAIAANNLIPQLDKLFDPRNSFDKLATSAAGFTGALTESAEAMKLLAAENDNLMKQDKTSGAGAFFQQKLADIPQLTGGLKAILRNMPGSSLIGGESFVDEIAKTREKQIQENKDAAQRINANNIKMSLSMPTVARDQAAFRTGAGLVEAGRSGSNIDIDKFAGEAFKEAMKTRAEDTMNSVQKSLMQTGMEGNKAQIEALTLMGRAANGVKTAFDDLAKRMPELNLNELAAGKKSAIETEENMKQLANVFRERQKVESEISNLEEQKAAALAQQKRTEIIGSSDVFMRNFTAGTGDDPVVKAIEKLGDRIEESQNKLKELN